VLRPRERHVHPLRLLDDAFANLNVAVKEAFSRTGCAEDNEAAFETLEGFAWANIDFP
jgi:hypothetical protein